MEKITFFFKSKSRLLKAQLLFLVLLGFLSSYSGNSQTIVEIGTGTSANSATGNPAIFANYYYGNKIQILYEASDLIANGATENSYINSIAFDVSNLNSVPLLDSFEVKVYVTSSEDPLSSTNFFSGMHSAVSLGPYSTTLGWNTLTLTTPILWNGCDNIVVEICAQNDYDTGSGNASTRYTAVTGTKRYVRLYRADNTSVCSATSGPTTPSNRPNIRFDFSPSTLSCEYVCSFVGVATTGEDIELSWDGTGASYEIEYGVSGFTLGTGTVITTTNLTETISSLSGSTVYDFYIEQICAGGSSAGVYGPIKVKTLCGVVGNFFEGFEDMPTYEYYLAPECWEVIYDDTSTNYYSDLYVQDYVYKSGSKGMYVYRDGGAGDFMMISPETNDLGNGTKRIRFSAYLDYYYPEEPKIEIYSLDGNTTSANKTLIETITLSDNGDWEDYTVVLPETTDDYFAFSFPEIGSGGYGEFYIDDIYYEDIPDPILTTTQNNNICFGGNTAMASVIVEEGLAPFTYEWLPSGGTGATATGLTAGDYTVTVTDALDRVVTATVTITEPNEILANPTITQVTCNGSGNGSVSLTVTGGTLPYKYLWDNGATTSSISNLSAGTYTVTITDIRSCSITETITITEPDVLVATNASQTDVSFYGGNDGSATVSVTGGTSPYSYLWSNGDTTATSSNLIAGTYTVTVTDDNGCTATQSFTIIQPIPLMSQSLTQTNVSCNAGNNGTATIVAMGGNAPYTYLWSPIGGTNATATGLSAGTYTVLVTDSTNNTITESFIITEPDALVASVSKTDITCNSANNGIATVNITGGTAPYSYFWSNGVTSATANNLNVGNYTVTVTDANNCKTTASVSIAQPSALVVTSTSTNISCYGQNDGSATISVTGGAAPYSYTWSNGQTGTTLNNLSSGTYIATITDANNCTATKSFTIIEPAFVHPPVAVNQSFCIGQNSTLADVVITGSNIKWYSAASGGTLLAPTTVLTSGTIYYASQTVGTCESVTRSAVQITLNQATALTTTQLNVCSNTRVQNMTIDGFNYTQLKWYSSATSTVVLPSSELLVTGTYYVSSVTGACESVRQAIQVTVAALVPAPSASAQVACGSSTLEDLVVVKDPGATLEWYSSLQSMIPLANTTTISSGTYYVQQVIGSCNSVRIAVSVQVINVSSPTMTSLTTCAGSNIADLHPATGKYVWYTDNVTPTALPETFVVQSGNYYIANELSGCVSSRVNVAVNVSPRPASPTGQSSQMFGFAARVSDLKMNQPNVSWFASANDAFKQVNQLTATHPLQDQTTYYGILTNANNCGSLVPTAVKVTINLSNAELDLTQLKYYPNPVDSELNISYIEEIKKVEVFTITGQRVFGNDYQGNEVKVDLSRLSAGTYLVKIETAKASQFVKIVKK